MPIHIKNKDFIHNAAKPKTVIKRVGKQTIL